MCVVCDQTVDMFMKGNCCYGCYGYGLGVVQYFFVASPLFQVCGHAIQGELVLKSGVLFVIIKKGENIIRSFDDLTNTGTL